MIVLMVAGLACVVALPLFGGAAVVAALLGAGGDGGGLEGVSVSSVAAIPAPILAIYQDAATVCPGLSWTVLAAIGTVESGNDQSTLPGVHSGHNPAGAEGPMQFEPATFARYDDPVPPGGALPPSPYDPADAVYAAARMLCANGAALGSGIRQAVFAYNHSNSYVAEVLGLAAQLRAASGLPTAAEAGASGWAGSGLGPGAGSAAVEFALAQIGTPYRWGGETPGVAFDCSGLVQAAFAAAGLRLPRVAQQQFDAGPILAPGAALLPGDLVFFGPPGGGVTHVGLVVDPAGEMVDAPHTGATVRLESFPRVVGSAWGGDVYLGATRPGVE
jgi:cell wall-associated NlpC family hydrolase